MKTSATVRVVAWGTTVVVLLVVLVSGLRGAWGYNRGWGWDWNDRDWSSGMSHSNYYENGSLYQSGSAAVAAEDVNRIAVDWALGGIQIQLHDGDSIEFEETANRDIAEEQQLHWLLQEGRLTIRYLSSGRHSNVPTKSLTLRLPREMAPLLDFGVDSVSSAVTLSGVSAQSIRLMTVSGSIQATGLDCDSIDFETISGRVSLQGTMHRIEGDSTSAGVTLYCEALPSELSVETISGNVQVELPEGDFVALLDSVSGDMSSNLPGARVSRSAVISGAAGPTYEFESVSGDVTIDLRRQAESAADNTETLTESTEETPTEVA